MELPKKVPQYIIVLFLIFVLSITLGIKLFFLFQTPYFQDSRSYYYTWQIENVAEKGIPEYTNDHSIDQSPIAVPPGYYLFMGYLHYFLPSLTFIKILEALIFITTLFFIFLLTKLTTQNIKAGLFAVLLTISMPLVWSYPQDILRPFYLSVVAILGFIYFFLKTNSNFESNKKFSDTSFIFSIWGLIAITIVVALFGINSLYLVFMLLLYISFRVINQSLIKIYLREIAIFVSLTITGIYFLTYRAAFAQHGIQTLWGNMPLEYYKNYVGLFNITNSLGLLNIVVVIGGIYGIYHFFKQEEYSKEKSHVVLYAAGVLTAVIFSILSAGTPEFVLLMGGIMLILCFTAYTKKMINYATNNYKLNISSDSYWILGILLIVIFGSLFNLSMFAPQSVSHVRPLYVSQDILDTFEWISENTPENSIIIASPEHAPLIRSISNRKFIIDQEFLFKKNPEKDMLNIKNIYTSVFISDPSRIIKTYLDEFNLKNTSVFVVLDSHIRDVFKVRIPRYTDDTECFSQIYQKNSSMIHAFRC